MREFKTKTVMPQLAVRGSAPPDAHPAIVTGAVQTYGTPATDAARERDARLRGMAAPPAPNIQVR